MQKRGQAEPAAASRRWPVIILVVIAAIILLGIVAYFYPGASGQITVDSCLKTMSAYWLHQALNTNQTELCDREPNDGERLTCTARMTNNMMPCNQIAASVVSRTCRAIEKRKTSDCSAIKDDNERIACIARVTGMKEDCANITNEDYKIDCEIAATGDYDRAKQLRTDFCTQDIQD
jgi:hypothetical protein